MEKGKEGKEVKIAGGWEDIYMRARAVSGDRNQQLCKPPSTAKFTDTTYDVCLAEN